MARGRMLNKTINASLKLHNLPDDTCRLLATWIIPHLDYRGVFYGDAAVVRSYVFPRRTDVTTELVEGYLQEMEAAGLIERFQANGDIWQHWPGFMDNQSGLRVDREKTTFPPPPCPQDGGHNPAEGPQGGGDLPAEDKLNEPKFNPSLNSSPSEDSLGANAPACDADYQEIRLAWIELFPKKPKPRENNATLRDKARTRMKKAHFQQFWRPALERAARSQFCNDGSWFDLAWFLKNDDHYERCLNGKYDGGGARAGPRSALDSSLAAIDQVLGGE